MRLRGDVLKQIRRKRGLSQTALAEGICTQATISLMEKQNRLPKMDILTAICERLNIQPDRIVENEVSGVNDTFNQIIDALTDQEYDLAKQLISKIRIVTLISNGTTTCSGWCRLVRTRLMMRFSTLNLF